MKTSRISNEHRLIFSVLWTVSTRRRFSRCCWLDKKMRRHHMKDVLCTQGWVLKERVIERSMTSRHHGRAICGWQQNQRPRRQDGRKTAKKRRMFLLTKQQICTCITLFCTFLCRRCTTASDIKLPNFTRLLYGVVEHDTKVVFFLFLT